MSESDAAEGADHVQVVVDADRCIGSGMCEMLEEAIFEINEDSNLAEVVGTGELPRERALIVVDKCPAAAISLVDAEAS